MNEEEFLAVVITNVYMSADGSTRLRGGYGDYDQLLEAPEDTTTTYCRYPTGRDASRSRHAGAAGEGPLHRVL